MKIFKTLALVVTCIASTVVSAEKLTLESLSPVVISSVPVAGNTTVDSSTTEIRVTFSKDMKTNKMWSVVQLGKSSFPQITGAVRFLKDSRTFVIPVKLKENTVYALGINSKTMHGFKGKNGKTAQPYLLSFKTNSKV